MNTRSLKMAVVAVALLVLTGCNIPFLNKAAQTVGEKAGKALEKTAGELQNLGGDEGQPSRDVEESNDESDSGSKTDVDECFKGCAMLSGTGMFSKEFCSDSCWAASAKDTGDVSICDTKVSKDNGLVLFACYMNVAETTKDVKHCDKIGDNSSDLMRGGCYGTVAGKIKDPSVCEGIKGNMMYQSCVDDATDGSNGDDE